MQIIKGLEMNKLISVVIPTHKRGDEVVNAVDSVLKSSVVPTEIIVVEDRSNEAESTLADMIANNSIRYFRKTDGNFGASATRNFGVSKARNKFVLFLDDDDRMMHSYIEKLIKSIQVTSCRWGFGEVLIDNKPSKFRHSSSVELKTTKFKKKIAGLGFGFWIDRELYETVCGLNEFLSIDEDTDLCCRLISLGYNPFYLQEEAVNVSRESGLDRLTTSTEGQRIVECYFKTLTSNYKHLANNIEAREFLLDRVHRVMCKYDPNQLSKLSGYDRSLKLKTIHYLRECRYQMRG